MGAQKKLDGTAPKTEPCRLVDVDNRNRSPVFGLPTKRPMFLRADRMAKLPLIVLDGGGREIARFSSPASLAQFLAADRGGERTVPQMILDHLNDLL